MSVHYQRRRNGMLGATSDAGGKEQSEGARRPALCQGSFADRVTFLAGRNRICIQRVEPNVGLNGVALGSCGSHRPTADARETDAMLRRIATLAMVAGCLVMAACATIEGAKEDAKSIGDTFSNATK
jgi:predicted small secreted protein